MTIETQQASAHYTGNGAVVLFPVTFPFASSTEIGVYVDGVKQLTGWVYENLNIRFDVPPADGAAVALYRETIAQQLFDADSNASDLGNELQLDRITMKLIELEDELGTAIRAGRTDTTGASFLLPDALTRQGKFLAFGIDGQLIATSAVTVDEIVASEFGAQLIQTENAEAARLLLNVTPVDVFWQKLDDAFATAKLRYAPAAGQSVVDLYRADPMGDNTVVGQLQFITPAGAATTLWASLVAEIESEASELGKLTARTMEPGGPVRRVSIGRGLAVGSETTDPGAGGINATNYQLNGVPLPITRGYESPPQPIVGGGIIVLAHGLGRRPRLVQGFLRCLTDEFGFVAGEVILIHLVTESDGVRNANCVVKLTDAEIQIGLFNSAKIFRVLRWSDLSGVELNNNNWELIVHAWA